MFFLHSKCGFGYEEIDLIPLEYGQRMMAAYVDYIASITEPFSEMLEELKNDTPDPDTPHRKINTCRPTFPPPPGAIQRK